MDAIPTGLQVFDLHADTVDLLGMADHVPFTEHDRFSGSLVRANAQLSADRMAPARWVQCYAIWIPDETDVTPLEWYREAAAWFHAQMRAHADRMAQARSFADIPGILDAGKVAAVLTVENGSPAGEGLDVVDEFAEDGVLIAGVTWNARNALGSGNDTDEGLTDLGRAYIAALEEHGIAVDVSHLNARGFWELDGIAEKPYVATHSNARAVCDHPRNLTDDQFRALTARGGVVGLNFHQDFVREGGGVYTFDELAAHVEHWLDLGGQGHIALGADRDGSTIPSWLADCSAQPYLFSRFAERFGDGLARKLFFGNAARFFG